MTGRRLVVGSYTEPYGPFRAVGRGVTLATLSPDGGLTREDELGGLANPAYVRVDAEIHAVIETRRPAGLARIAVEGRRLRLLGTAPVPGDIPCHLDVAPGGDWLAGCCYGSGHVFVRRPASVADSDGLCRTGGSIHPVRQTSAHPHACRFSPDGRWLLVPDLGTDEIACYPFDPSEGRLSAPRPWRAPPGSGPRLLLFSADGRHVVLVHELASTVSSLRWEDGTLVPVSTVSSLLSPGGPNTAAGLRWHPSGRMLGVTNRGADSVTLIAFDPEDGRLAPLSEHPSGGAKPRDLDFSPCGRWLVVGNQDGDSLAVLAVEPSRLVDTGARLAVASPSCVRFLDR